MRGVQQANGASAEFLQPEESRYVLALRVGVRAALLLLVGLFAIYVSGLLELAVPMADLPAHWGDPASELVAETDAPGGWSWATMLGHGDVLTILSAVLLASLSAVALAAVLPIYLRRRDWAFVAIIVLQIIVLAVAAITGGAR